MINLCLFGAGRIGAIHANCVNQHSDVKIRYVVDVYEPAALKLAQQCGAIVTDTKTALADPEINGVIIASSTDTHADLIEQAALAGKAIFCEKPIDLDIERVRRCLAVVAETGVLCAIGFNRRFDPQFAKVKQAIQENRVGEVEIISVTSRDPSPPPIEYIKVSGGIFRDMMIHDFDMARWLLQEEPIEVFATASCQVDPKISEAGDVDSALVTLKTASGKLCQINNSRRSVYGYDQRIEVFGSKGMVQANNNLESNLVVTGELGSLAEKPQYFFLERYAQAYRLELDNYVSCLRDEAVPMANANDGMQALLLAEAAVKSLATGQAVSLL